MMRTVRVGRYVLLALGIGALIAGLLAAGRPEPALAAAAFGAVWAGGEAWGRGWFASLSLALLTALSAAAVLGGLPAGWLAGGLILLLAAWSLGHFVRRMEDAPAVDDLDARARAALLRAGGLALASAGLVAAALLVELRLTFVPALALAALLVFGLSRAISAARRA